jgi:hypothetical protein
MARLGWRRRSQDGIARPADSPLDQQFQVRRAGFVSVEAVVEGVFQIVETEVPRTAGVSSIQKRTVNDAIRH